MSWEAGCQCIMQNHNENRAYAGFFVRLLAFGIDSLIAAMASATVMSPFSLAAGAGLDFFDKNFLFHYSFLDVLGYVAVAVYFVLLTYFTHTTPGKALFRLEVVTVDKEWTLWNIVYRETIGRFLSSLLCVGYFSVLISSRKQGFHDMLCDTLVVYKGMVPAKKQEEPVVQPVFTDSVEVTPVAPEMQQMEPQEPTMEAVQPSAIVSQEKEQQVTAQESPVSMPTIPEQKVQPVVAPTYYSKNEIE